MTKKIIILFIFVMNILSAQKVQKSGKEETLEIPILEINNLKLKTSIKAELIPSLTKKVVINADRNIIPYIEVLNDKDELEIKLKNNLKLKDNFSINIKIYNPEVPNIELSGSSSITINNKFNKRNDLEIKLSGASTLKGLLSAENLDISVSGSSNIDIIADSNDLELDLQGSSNAKVKGRFDEVSSNISGASDLYINGSSKKLEAKISGASSFKGNSFETNTLKASISGSSKMVTRINHAIYIDVSGASSFEYFGPADIKRQKISGASYIKKM